MYYTYRSETRLGKRNVCAHKLQKALATMSLVFSNRGLVCQSLCSRSDQRNDIWKGLAEVSSIRDSEEHECLELLWKPFTIAYNESHIVDQN